MSTSLSSLNSAIQRTQGECTCRGVRFQLKTDAWRSKGSAVYSQNPAFLAGERSPSTRWGKPDLGPVQELCSVFPVNMISWPVPCALTISAGPWPCDCFIGYERGNSSLTQCEATALPPASLQIVPEESCRYVGLSQDRDPPELRYRQNNSTVQHGTCRREPNGRVLRGKLGLKNVVGRCSPPSPTAHKQQRSPHLLSLPGGTCCSRAPTLSLCIAAS